LPDNQMDTQKDRSKKNVVILGAGFGGLQVAMRIARDLRRAGLLDRYRVALMDRNAAQAYTPVLYEWAAAPNAPTPPKNVVLDLFSLVKGLPISFMRGEVTEIDLVNGDIHLATGEELKAEFVVIALGSEANYFGIKGMQENTIPLKTFADAEKIRAALGDFLKNKPNPRVVVGGAGSNGIELAGQIKFLHKNCDVMIVEAMPTILPGLAANLAAAVAKRLAKLGITVMVNSKIMGVEAGTVQLDGGKMIPFDLMIWAGGIKAPDLVSKLPLRAERGKPVAEMGMVCVPQTPDLKLYPMVYVLGDSVCFYDPKTGHPLPATAPIAMAQAKVVAANVMEEIKKKENPNHKPAPKTYSAIEYPYVIPVGGHWAAAQIGSVVFTGWPAWMFHQFIELDYLISVMPFFKALGAWF
jgi:NADH dehydrogenase